MIQIIVLIPKFLKNLQLIKFAILEIVNQRRLENKAESFSIDKKYQIYFDTQYIQSFDFNLNEADTIENEIDYLSENELDHFNREEDIPTLIRRANKILQRFKQLNDILSNHLHNAVVYNLKAVNKILNNSRQINILDDYSDSDEDLFFDYFKDVSNAFTTLEDNAKLIKIKTQIGNESFNFKSQISNIVKNRDKPRRNSVMPKIVNMGLDKISKRIDLFNFESNQGQGDCIIPIRIDTKLFSEDDTSNINLTQDQDINRSASNLLFHPRSRRIGYEDSAISEQIDEEDSFE